MYSARFDTRQVCGPCGPDRWIPRRRRAPGPRRRNASQAGGSGRRRVGLRGDCVLYRSAVLRPQAGSGALPVFARVVRLGLRRPRSTLATGAFRLSISEPRSVAPTSPAIRPDTGTAATPVRWRASPVRRQQPAAHDARHVSTAGHVVLSRFVLCKKPGGALPKPWGARGLPFGGSSPLVARQRRRASRPGWCEPDSNQLRRAAAIGHGRRTRPGVMSARSTFVGAC